MWKTIAAVCLALATATVSADSVNEPATAKEPSNIVVKTFWQTEEGNLEELDISPGAVKAWVYDDFAEGKDRLVKEVSALFPKESIEIHMISIFHPDNERTFLRRNKYFIDSHITINPASLIPFVGRAVPRKLEVFAAMNLRIKIAGQRDMTITGLAKAETEYVAGIRFVTAQNEAIETVGRSLFLKAVDNAISALRVASEQTEAKNTTAPVATEESRQSAM